MYSLLLITRQLPTPNKVIRPRPLPRSPLRQCTLCRAPSINIDHVYGRPVKHHVRSSFRASALHQLVMLLQLPDAHRSWPKLISCLDGLCRGCAGLTPLVASPSIMAILTLVPSAGAGVTWCGRDRIFPTGFRNIFCPSAVRLGVLECARKRLDGQHSDLMSKLSVALLCGGIWLRAMVGPLSQFYHGSSSACSSGLGMPTSGLVLPRQ
jgi:hypothetical protein